MKEFKTEREIVKYLDKQKFLIKTYLYITAFFFISSVLFIVPIMPISENKIGLLSILIIISIIISPIIYLIFFREAFLSFILIWIFGIFWANFIVFCIFSFTPIQNISAKIINIQNYQGSKLGEQCYIQVNTQSNDVNQYLYKIDCDKKIEINQTITLNYKQNFLGIVSAD